MGKGKAVWTFGDCAADAARRAAAASAEAAFLTHIAEDAMCPVARGMATRSASDQCHLAAEYRRRQVAFNKWGRELCELRELRAL